MQYRVISADSHVSEPSNAYQDRLPAGLKDRGPKIVECEDGGQGWTVEGSKPRSFGLGVVAGKKFTEYKESGFRWSDLLPGNYDAREHLKDNATDGVDASVIYAGFGMNMGATIKDRDLRLACFRAYNDWLAEEFISEDPQRIIGLAPLPVDDGIDLAVEELRRAVEKGHKGGFLPTYPDSPYPNLAYEPLWQAAEELDVPLHFHRASGRNIPPGMNVNDKTGSVHLATIVLRFFATLEPISNLLFSGVLHRHPRLKFVTAETDFGWLPFFSQICDDQFERQRYWSKLPFDRKPSEYLREQVYVTFMDDAFGCASVPHIGHENLMWASDYPHSVTTWPKSREYIDRQMAPCTPEQRAAMLSGNAVRLYKLANGN